MVNHFYFIVFSEAFASEASFGTIHASFQSFKDVKAKVNASRGRASKDSLHCAVAQFLCHCLIGRCDCHAHKDAATSKLFSLSKTGDDFAALW